MSGWGFVAAICASGLATTAAAARSRAVCHGEDGAHVTVRSMDWRDRRHTERRAFPRGPERRGAVGARAPGRTSRCGRVLASAFGAATVGGRNEAGRAANLLCLTGSADRRSGRYGFDAATRPNVVRAELSAPDPSGGAAALRRPARRRGLTPIGPPACLCHANEEPLPCIDPSSCISLSRSC